MNISFLGLVFTPEKAQGALWFMTRVIIYWNEIEVKNRRSKSVWWCRSTERIEKNKKTRLVVKNLKEQRWISDDCILSLFNKRNEFYTPWLCFLIIITLQVEPCVLYLQQWVDCIQEHNAKQDDECCLLIFSHVITLSCVIALKVLIWLNWAATGIMPLSQPAFYHFTSLSLPPPLPLLLCLFHHPSGFNTTEALWIKKKKKKKADWWRCQAYCVHCFLKRGRAVSCLLSLHICLRTSG